jgi:energy-converting hydrogenase Eha subunit A
MQFIAYVVFLAAFVWLMVTVQSRRKVIAVTITGVMVMTLVGVPQPAHAQSGVLGGIQAILSVISGVIQTALTSINTVRTAENSWQQAVAWPQPLINQAQSQVTQMIGRYRTLMSKIFHVNLNSATLPNPQAFEAVIRDHEVSNFSSLTAAFGNTYGPIPAATAANPTDRAMSDMDDALALDNLKMLKASDQAADIELQSADSIENAASQAAPGSAPFLTATAIVSGIHGQAWTQKMLAAELRQEAARLAHRNTLRKENATNTTQLRGVLVNLLQHQ